MTRPAGPPSTYVISLTPFDAGGGLDDDGLRGHLRRMAAAGVGVYLGGSGSGEGYTLPDGELDRIFAIGREELNGRVPVLAMGVEPRTAGQMVELGRRVEDAGLDGMQVYSLDQGHGNQPTRTELERYLRDVLEGIDVPAVLSSHQSVGYFVPADLLGTMVADYEHVVGVNCTSPDQSYLLRVLEAVDGRVDVHVGGPMHALTCLALGGQGYLSSDANLAPRLCQSVIDRFVAGDLAGCASAYRTLMELFTATRDCGGIVATKGALRLLDLPGGFPRRPRLPVDAATEARIRETMLDALDLRALEGLAVEGSG
jgi:4-hydroxy-tetrahydrodipicolinate synthase